MKNKIIYLLLVLLIISSNLWAATDNISVLSLKDCYRLALDQNAEEGPRHPARPTGK